MIDGYFLSTSLRESNNNRLILIVGSIFVLSVVAYAHWPSLTAKTISFDDHEYFLRNHLVKNPSWASAKQFLSEMTKPSTVGGYYQPLSMISLMLDCQMGATDENLMPLHRSSLILHLCNTFLVILILYALFKNPIIALMTGLLFGCHPMTVEPIPWIGERKTVLAGFFGFLSLLSYIKYAQSKTLGCYISALICFVLALMSKPTVTPLPILFILLDYWPLKKLSIKSLLNKIPFFAIAIVSGIITIISQKSAALSGPGNETSLIDVLVILCYSNSFYLTKIFWPINLTSHYPFPDPIALSNPDVLKGVVITLILMGCVAATWLKTRAFVVGWLFFFIAALPTMQILRFSDVVASDKFAYFSSFGYLLMVAFFFSGVWAIKTNSRVVRIGLSFIVAGICLCQIKTTRAYLVDWQDTESHYRRMIRIEPKAAVPYFALGCYLQEQQRFEEALENFKLAVEFKHDYPQAHNNLAKSYEVLGQYNKAIASYQQLVKLKPNDHNAYFALATAYAKQNKYDLAIPLFQYSIKLQPNFVQGHGNLAIAYYLAGKSQKAKEHFTTALRLNPNYLEGHLNYAIILQSLKEYTLALHHYQQVIKLSPNHSSALSNIEKIKSFMSNQKK